MPRRKRKPCRLLPEVADYLEHLKLVNCTPATIHGRGETLERFAKFLAGQKVARLQDVDVKTVEAYLTALLDDGLARSSVEKYLADVRNLFDYMERQGMIFENPARDVHLLERPVFIPEVITVDEAHRMLNAPDIETALGIRDRAILEVLYATGVRRSEMVGMTLTSLNLDEELVRVTGKGRKQRLVPLGRHATHWIRKYLTGARAGLLGTHANETDLLWASNCRKPLEGPGLAVVVHRYARTAGIPRLVSTHTLRRTCATHLLLNGAHPVAVAEMLGHADLSSLGHYLRVTPADLVEMLRRSRPGT